MEPSGDIPNYSANGIVTLGPCVRDPCRGVDPVPRGFTIGPLGSGVGSLAQSQSGPLWASALGPSSLRTFGHYES